MLHPPQAEISRVGHRGMEHHPKLNCRYLISSYICFAVGFTLLDNLQLSYSYRYSPSLTLLYSNDISASTSYHYDGYSILAIHVESLSAHIEGTFSILIFNPIRPKSIQEILIAVSESYSLNPKKGAKKS